MHNKFEVLAPRVEGPQASQINGVDSSEGLAGVTQSRRVAKPVASVSDRPKGRGSRSAWFMPKPKPLGPDIPYAMDDAYWAELVPDGDVVYFFGASKCHGDGTIELVKIGHSRNLGNRLNQLCSNMGMMRGELLVSAVGGVDRERAYHKHFAEHRQSGEWFRPDYAILAEVARLKGLEA